MNISLKIAFLFTSIGSLSLIAHQVTAHNTTTYTIKVGIPTAVFQGTPAQGNSIQFILEPGQSKTVEAAAGYCIDTRISLTDSKTGKKYSSALPFDQNILHHGYINGSYTFTIKEQSSSTETILYAELNQ